MGMSWAEHTVEIDAPIETCFEAIVDYESFPDWQNAVDSVEVQSRTKDGVGEEVKLFVDAKVRKIDYVLRYRYERPTVIEWDFVTGNGMRDVDGVYSFEEVSAARTSATYKLGADPEIPVPGPVARRVHKQLVKRSVEDLKNEAERRHAAGGAAEAAPAEARAAGEGEPAADAGSDWVPKAERGEGETPSRPSRPGAGLSVPSLSELPGEVLGRAAAIGKNPVKESRDLAESAVRAGKSLAGLAAELGKEAAGRVDEALSGRRRDDE